MPIVLRDYQIKLIDEVREEFRDGIRRPCIVAPCGSGKTVIMAWMAKQTAHNGKRTWFLVHRQELIDQAAQTFHNMGVRAGIIGSGININERIQIGSVMTVVRRMKRLPLPDLIILDEAHHSLAATWRKIITANPQARVIGLTATPIRLNGDGLGDVFETLVMGPSVSELIETGNLVNYRYYAPEIKADLSNLRMHGGDYGREELIARMDRSEIIGDALEHYKQLAIDKRAIIYCAGIEHSKHVTKIFQNAGIMAAHIDGETKETERKQTIDAFRRGEIKVISNVDLISEGFDVPSMDAVIMLRPTASMGLYVQQAMRAMRPDSGRADKEALIIDHVGNVHRHGLPDEERAWSLERKKRKASNNEVMARTCPACYYTHPIAVRICPGCGHVYEVEERKGPAEVKGQLFEISAVERRERRLELRNARTRRDFEMIAFQRGYKLGWVNHQLRLRGIK